MIVVAHEQAAEVPYVLLLAAAVMELLPIAHAEQYRVGDAEISGMVKNLEIEWTSGKVCIEYHSGSSVIISEKANGRISEDGRLGIGGGSRLFAGSESNESCYQQENGKFDGIRHNFVSVTRQFQCS